MGTKANRNERKKARKKLMKGLTQKPRKRGR